jgi:hypothetical protein
MTKVVRRDGWKGLVRRLTLDDCRAKHTRAPVGVPQNPATLIREDKFIASLANHQRGQFVTEQRSMIIGPSSPPLWLSERELDALTDDEFEEVMRTAFRAGHWESEGVPRMSVLELKTSGSGHGLDGVGLRRRSDLVDLYKLEFKQVRTGSIHVPSLDPRAAGTQGGREWAKANIDKLLRSDDPVAFESLDQLTRRLRKYFGPNISEDLVLEAFKLHLGNAPLIAATRAHAPLDKLLPRPGPVAWSRQCQARLGVRTQVADQVNFDEARIRSVWGPGKFVAGGSSATGPAQAPPDARDCFSRNSKPASTRTGSGR